MFEIIFLLIILVTFIILSIKKRGFWNKQPVMNNYHKFFKQKNTQIVNRLSKNKWYTNECKTLNIKLLTRHQKNTILKFIHRNYLINNDIVYKPTFQIWDKYKNTSHPSYITYKFNTAYYKSNNKIIQHKELVGILSSIPVLLKINNKTININYIDLLCVKKKYRNNKLACNLISTMAYNIETLINQNIFIFKKENTPLSIKPFISYNSYMFEYNKIKLPNIFPYNIVKATIKNLNLFYDMLYKINKKYLIVPSIGNLYQLIESNLVKIYGLVHNNEICSIYVFRDSDTIIDNTPYLELFFSYNKSNKFVEGFYHALVDIPNFKKLYIDNLCHNNEIIKEISKKFLLNGTFNNYFYFYNFTFENVSNDECFLFI